MGDVTVPLWFVFLLLGVLFGWILFPLLLEALADLAALVIWISELVGHAFRWATRPLRRWRCRRRGHSWLYGVTPWGRASWRLRTQDSRDRLCARCGAWQHAPDIIVKDGVEYKAGIDVPVYWPDEEEEIAI